LSVFGIYSRYYDLLYADKDYAREVDFVCTFIRQHAPEAKLLLELGCGTGIHASLFAERGFRVTGIDLSTEMLAKTRDRNSSTATNGLVDFQQGDIRDMKLERPFDVVVALFHVISYLPTNFDLDSAFARIREHLKPGGLLLFDHWYGPAVLIDPPVPRTKRFENDDITITRVATPTLFVNDNLVDVRYDVTVIEKSSGRSSEFTESHRMRYFFWPEIESLLSRHCMRPITFRKWLVDEAPDETSWNSLVVAAAAAG
jgi:SAM-dependent methyltransferase